MYDDLNNICIDIENRIDKIIEILPSYVKILHKKPENPKETVDVYFQSLQLNMTIESFFELRKNFLELDIFEDPFIKYEMPGIGELLIFNEMIKEGKDNFCSLIDMDFLNSQARTLRLWGTDYVPLLESFSRSIMDIKARLKIINKTWYNNNKHLMFNNHTSNKIFLDEKNMTIYKLVQIPKDDNAVFELIKFVYNPMNYKNKNKSIMKIKINPKNISKFNKEELFLEVCLEEYFTEYFI